MTALARLREAWENLRKNLPDPKVADCPDVEIVDAAISALLASAPTLTEPPNGCPCTLTTPCSYACTCANPVMSGGCLRCARYGSLEQRKAIAEALAALPLPGTAPSGREAAREAFEKALDAFEEKSLGSVYGGLYEIEAATKARAAVLRLYEEASK